MTVVAVVTAPIILATLTLIGVLTGRRLRSMQPPPPPMIVTLHGDRPRRR